MSTPSVASFSDVTLPGEQNPGSRGRSTRADPNVQSRARHFENALLTTAAPGRSDHRHDLADRREVRPASRHDDKRDREPIRPRRPGREDVRSDRPRRNEVRADDARRADASDGSEPTEPTEPRPIDRDAGSAHNDGRRIDDDKAATETTDDGADTSEGPAEATTQGETDAPAAEQPTDGVIHAHEGDGSATMLVAVEAMTAQVSEAESATVAEEVEARTDTAVQHATAAGMEQVAAVATGGQAPIASEVATTTVEVESEATTQVGNTVRVISAASTGAADSLATDSSERAATMAATMSADRQTQSTTTKGEVGQSVVDHPSMKVEGTGATEADSGDQGTGPDQAQTQPTDAGVDTSAESTMASTEGATGEAATTLAGPTTQAVSPGPTTIISPSGAENPTGAIAGIGTVSSSEQAPTVRAEGASRTAGTAQADANDASDSVWRQVRRALGSTRTTPSGDQQLTIRLRPAELGSVMVRITTGEAGTA
ncbi:MAG: hypothetical protein GY773_32620, partial [Actinomycetia bacterium]|nr:hypothetical protein [Actinomycetes bacterium]